MKRLVLLASLLFLAAACSNVSGNVGVGYELGPVEFSATFSIHADGSISVGGSVGLVTEIGVFSLSADIEANSQPAPDETLLFIRHRVARGVVDTEYDIGTGEDVTVVLNGLTTVNVSDHEVTIDASKGNVKEVTIRNEAVPPSPAQQAQPSPGGGLRLLRTIKSSTVSIVTVSWSPDGRLIADAGESGESGDPTTAEIRRVSDGSLVSTHGGLTHFVQDISWSPNGALIAAADQGCSCTRIWNAPSGQATATIDDYANQISWSPDSGYVVTSGFGDHPTVWNASTGGQVSSFGGYPAFGNLAAWAPHGNLVSGGGEIWDAPSGRQVQAFNGLNRGQFNTFAWSPDARRIVSLGISNLVDWDASTGATIWDVPPPDDCGLLAWSPDGTYIACAGDTGQASVLYASSGQLAGNFGLPDGNQVDALAWSPDGRYIATVSDGVIRLWAAPR